MKPYCTTSQVLNQAIQQLAVQARWNVSEPGTVVIQDITYTALAVSGASPVSIAYTPGGTAGHEVVTVNGNAITVQIENGISTATEIQTAVAALPAAAALVYAEITGVSGASESTTTAPISITGDVLARIMEADNEIDTRLAGLGVPLPFVINPPVLQNWSMLYARYACLRDLYTGTNPQAGSDASKSFLAEFEAKWTQIREGWQVLLDNSSTIIQASKFTPQTVAYPVETPVTDNYPRAPQGPYPDLPGTQY